MRVAFTKSGSILSRLIRWSLDEPVSHMIIIFDEKVVIHSNLLGVHLTWIDHFLKSSEIVFSVDGPVDLPSEEYVYQKAIASHDGQWYDFGAFIYFCWRGALKKFFNKPIPSFNPFNSSKAYLCTELAASLPAEMVRKLNGIDLSITSPYQVFLRLSA